MDSQVALRLIHSLLITTILLLLVIGCSTERHWKDRWIGRSKRSLITRLGKPNKIDFSSDGSEILVYSKVYLEYDPAFAFPSYPQVPVNVNERGASNYSEDNPLEYVPNSSETRFWINFEGVIYKVGAKFKEN